MSDRVEEIEAIRKRIEAIGEKDETGGGYWLELACAKELGISYKRVWIHTTRNEKFVRYEKDDEKFGYNQRGALLGGEDQPLMIQTEIDNVPIYRHRAMALAAGIMTLEQYRDTKNFRVDHVEPRKPRELPDDRPENLRVGSPSANNLNPKNKKRGPRADGKPVTLTWKSTGETLPFPSARAAAVFLGVNKGGLYSYLTRGEGSLLSIPKGLGAVWGAKWAKVDGFDCEDAVPIPGALEGDERRISPTKGLLRVVGDGKYALATNVPKSNGYLTAHINGKDVLLHRLVFKTFKLAEFEAELAKLPPGTDESKLQIDHIDGDKTNNALSNLRPMDSRAHNSKHSAAIRWIDEDGQVLDTYATAAEAARAVLRTHGQTIQRTSVLDVCKKVQKHTGGRKFEFVDDAHAKGLMVERAEKKLKRGVLYA